MFIDLKSLLDYWAGSYVTLGKVKAYYVANRTEISLLKTEFAKAIDFNSGAWEFYIDLVTWCKVFTNYIMINTAIPGAPYLVVLSGNFFFFENE